MIKRILVPLGDNSPHPAVMEKAMRMAGATKAKLIGLGVIDEPTIMKGEPTAPGASDFVERKQHAQMEKSRVTLEKAMEDFQALCKKGKVQCETLLLHGEPHRTIIDESEKHDLIVMAQSTNYKFATQRERCETMENVLKATARPVVIIPDKLPEGSRGIMFATDGSPGSNRALQMYQLSGLGRGRQMHIVSIHEDGDHAAANCARAASYLEAHNIKAEVHPIQSADKPWNVLLDDVRRHPPEVIVMGAYGQSGLKDFFFGSVTSEFIKTSPIPMFIFH